MSAPINNGGPAFPAPSGWDSQGNWCRSYSDADGMTLRDYFAAKALNGLMGRNWDGTGSDDEIIATWARSAYAVADAMLEAREADHA